MVKPNNYKVIAIIRGYRSGVAQGLTETQANSFAKYASSQINDGFWYVINSENKTVTIYSKGRKLDD